MALSCRTALSTACTISAHIRNVFLKSCKTGEKNHGAATGNFVGTNVSLEQALVLLYPFSIYPVCIEWSSDDDHNRPLIDLVHANSSRTAAKGSLDQAAA